MLLFAAIFSIAAAVLFHGGLLMRARHRRGAARQVGRFTLADAVARMSRVVVAARCRRRHGDAEQRRLCALLHPNLRPADLVRRRLVRRSLQDRLAGTWPVPR